MIYKSKAETHYNAKNQSLNPVALKMIEQQKADEKLRLKK